MKKNLNKLIKILRHLVKLYSIMFQSGLCSPLPSAQHGKTKFQHFKLYLAAKKIQNMGPILPNFFLLIFRFVLLSLTGSYTQKIYLLYSVRRLIGSRKIESAIYCNDILLVPLYLNSTQNTSVYRIIRLLLSLLCEPKVILLSGGHCSVQHSRAASSSVQKNCLD